MDAELEAAIAGAGLVARSVREVSTLPSAATKRAVFRIEVQGGLVVKARRLENEHTARRLFERQCLLPDGFARAFRCEGRVLFEEWVGGGVLGREVPQEAHLVAGGSLLAALHATAVALPPGRREVTAPWHEEAERSLGEMASAGWVDAHVTSMLRASLRRHDPGEATVGLIHVDFCGENMVVDHAGRIRVIDNDRLRPGPLAYDMARTWYRWALPPPEWDCFQTAYRASASSGEAIDAPGFWRIVAVLKSAMFRARVDPATLHVPLGRLIQLGSPAAQG